MKTNKIIHSIAIIILIILVGCRSSNSTLGLFRILKMNQKEFEEIHNISIEDEKGFKFIKTSLETNKFKSFSTSKENQTITKDDKERIKKILKKY